jgi:hypothetical protein
MFKVPIVIAAAALSAGLAATAPASATVLSGSSLPILAVPSVSNAELVANRMMHRRWVYNRHRHGQRFAFRHGGYRFYHGGWWYSQPWWDVGPAYGFGVIAPGYSDYGNMDDEHVQYCLSRYRSYDPESDTFIGYDGMQHPCIGP